MQPFSPIHGATIAIAASSAGSAAAAFPAGVLPGGAYQVRVHNAGASTAFVDFGAADVVAGTGDDLPIPAGAVEVLTVVSTEQNRVTHAAAITASGTATVYFTPGAGI